MKNYNLSTSKYSHPFSIFNLTVNVFFSKFNSGVFKPHFLDIIQDGLPQLKDETENFFKNIAGIVNLTPQHQQVHYNLLDRWLFGHGEG